jgi:mono/diheme cytochrome c family protein
MRMLRIGILVGVSMLINFGCSDSSSIANLARNVNKATPGTPVPTATVDELASGKKVFETNCMICHRSDGTGGKLTVEGKSLDVDDLTSAKIKAMTDEKLIGYIMKGVPDDGMPAFQGKLSEGEMRDVVKYIRTEFHGQ